MAHLARKRFVVAERPAEREAAPVLAGSDELQPRRIDDVERRFRGMSAFGFLACLIVVTLAVQLCVSTGSYSGQGVGPKFGDFEAQRHWMEITIHLPVSLWYVNISENNLDYWGLDYPPLTAYHSYIMGIISDKLNPSWVALNSSRGIETLEHKVFMRATVLFSMWTLYIPALAAFVYFYSKSHCKLYHFAISILYPGLISIDNGHFQYNHISLGFFVIAVYLLVTDRPVIGSIAFTMAVHYKQMELYHALPIAVFLFATSIHMPLTPANFFTSAVQMQKLLVVVLMSVAMIWAPMCARGARPYKVLERVFPFYRGLFEDKVANLWCSLSVLIKLKSLIDIPTLLALSTVAVLISHIPSLITVFIYPFPKNLLLGLVISSFSFFLFSFQVHEKSILLVAGCALFVWPRYPVSVSWFLIISCTSMYPLCVQDGNALHLAMFIMFYLFVSPCFSDLERQKFRVVHGSCLLAFGLCFASLVIPSPERYPHLFQLLIAVYSFVHFFGFFIYFNVAMLENCCKKRSPKVL